MERERMLDKRKARDKETDDESTDSSKNPMKRPRVDYSSSPKEPSPSPASAQKSPLKSSSVADSLAAATPAQDKSGSGSNGDVALSPSKPGGKNNGSSDEASLIPPKFDLPPPLSVQELKEKIGESEVSRDDSDSDNGSTKFLSDIIQSEEKKKRQGKGKGGGSSTGAESGGGRNGTPVANAKRGSAQAKSNIKTEGKASHQPGLTSSPLSDLSTLSSLPNGNHELEVLIKINCPSTQTVFMEETAVRSDIKTMENFFRQHNMTLTPPSSQSQIPTGGSSGYLGDVSSVDSSAGHLQGTTRVASNSRWTISSLGSTIPRNSIVSIATDKSDSPDELMKRPGRPVSKARKRSDGPIMSSTRFDESSRSSSLMDRMNVSPNPVSNGEDFSPPTSAFPGKKSAKSQSSRVNSDSGSAASPTKKLKGNSSNVTDRDEGLGTPSQSATPGSSKNSRKSTKATPTINTSFNSDSGISTGGKKPGVRRRVGSASNFPITNVPVPMLNTPPPARSVAKIEGTVAKPISQFEQELNNEPVVEAELEKASTLWSSILPEELVFARWRDKSYYSGMVKSKGLNDTWIIDFDDGMEDVASESHIVPIRILGVGVKGIYSPDEKYEARSAEVIGQKFGKDPETGRQAVKYAIKISGESTPIWCSRRQLSIKENDAKKLRMEYQPPVAIKAGDVSLDNIVSGPRRRTRGGNESENSTADSKSVAGALDKSSVDDNSDLPTPKSKPGPRAGKKTPASEAKKKRTTPATTVKAGSSTPLTKDASTSSPLKDVTEKKESPVKKDSPAKKKSVIEFGKKKSKKTLFQGIQFFLTASGGGDPGISGNPIPPPEPYDKDEIREAIENCGGEILDNVGSETVNDVFLISDSYARTVKYIYCMAATIPCVSHMWIKRCLELNEIVEWNVFKLPAGWSLEHQDLIQHHVKRPLKGCKVFVTSESDQLYNYWKPVLTAAEAVLLKPPKKKGTLIPSGTEVVVTDNHSEFLTDLLREAKALNLQVVKPEWLVQTIITGEKAHVYGHEKEKIYFQETEESEDTLEEPSQTGDENCENFDVLAHMQSPD